MSDYFSKYKGRGGPAIEPGIIQMMGSIGDEYAKGITSFADSIASGIEAKAEREKTEEANRLFKDLVSGPKQIEDPDAFKDYENDRIETTNAFKEEARLSEEAEQKAVADSAELQKQISAKPTFTGISADNLNTFSGEMPKEFLDDITYTQDKSKSSQVTKLNKEIEKYKDSYGRKTEKLYEFQGQESELLDQIKTLEDQAIVFAAKRKDGSPVVSGYPTFTPVQLTENEKIELKEKKDALKIIQKRIKTLGGEDYARQGDYLEKLDSLKQMEIHQPGSSIGFSKLVRGPSGDWLEEIDERSRIVEDRRRLFNHMALSPEWESRSQEFPLSSGAAIASMIDDNTIKGLGIRAEDLNAILTLPQEEMSQAVLGAKNRMRIAHDKLQEYQNRIPLTQEDFTRSQTRQEFLSDVIQKVDTGKLRKDVLPFVASYLDKTKKPSVTETVIDGQKFIVADPKTTSITRVGSDVTSKLAVLKFQNEIEKGKYRDTVALDKDFNTRKDALTSEIATYVKGKESQLSPFDSDNLVDWGDADEKRLDELRTMLKDLQRIYASQRKKLGGNELSPTTNTPTISF